MDGGAHVGKWYPRRIAPVNAEQRLKELGIKLPAPPEPFGTYVEAVQTGNLLFLTGMLPTEGRAAKFVGRVGAELDVEAGRKAAHLAAVNALAVARQHLGSLDKVTRIVRLGVSVATSGDVRDQPKVADAASELLQDVFGKEKNPCRLVYGVASLRSALRSSWKSVRGGDITELIAAPCEGPSGRVRTDHDPPTSATLYRRNRRAKGGPPKTLEHARS